MIYPVYGEEKVQEQRENGCMWISGVLAAMVILIMISCCTKRHGVYHYSSGKNHMVSDEPVGPYHIIGDPQSPAAPYVMVKPFKPCNHIWVVCYYHESLEIIDTHCELCGITKP